MRRLEFRELGVAVVLPHVGTHLRDDDTARHGATALALLAQLVSRCCLGERIAALAIRRKAAGRASLLVLRQHVLALLPPAIYYRVVNLRARTHSRRRRAAASYVTNLEFLRRGKARLQLLVFHADCCSLIATDSLLDGDDCARLVGERVAASPLALAASLNRRQERLAARRRRVAPLRTRDLVRLARTFVAAADVFVADLTQAVVVVVVVV